MNWFWSMIVRLWRPPLADEGEIASDRSVYERFAIPYTFKPQLSFFEAVVSAAAAFLRIFGGSLLFAIWGSYSLFFWSTIQNLTWRLAVLLGLFAAFLIAALLYFVVIAAIVRGMLSKSVRPVDRSPSS